MNIVITPGKPATAYILSARLHDSMVPWISSLHNEGSIHYIHASQSQTKPIYYCLHLLCAVNSCTRGTCVMILPLPSQSTLTNSSDNLCTHQMWLLWYFSVPLLNPLEYEVLKAVAIEIPFPWNMTACGLVYVHQSIQSKVPKKRNTALARFWYSKFG